MLTLRRAADRGHADHGWLNTHHSFSFAHYYDPKHMGFRGLRVINEDRVAAGRGFGTHPHRDMEIISYVLEGSLEHRDSMGTGSVIQPGEVQRMSAGTGVLHSEYNGSKSDPVRFIQIWIMPTRTGIMPSYEQRAFETEHRRNQLRLVVAPGGAQGALDINADVQLYTSLLDAGRELELELARGRHAWVQVLRGRVELDTHTLEAGDGAALSELSHLRLRAVEDSELLVFDLA